MHTHQGVRQQRPGVPQIWAAPQPYCSVLVGAGAGAAHASHARVLVGLVRLVLLSAGQVLLDLHDHAYS